MGEYLGNCCAERHQEDRCFRNPRHLQVEDSHKASYCCWQEGDLRQGSHGESQTSKDHCESVPSCRNQEKHLSVSAFVCCISGWRFVKATSLALAQYRARALFIPLKYR